jgi:hypothetical protein
LKDITHRTVCMGLKFHSYKFQFLHVLKWLTNMQNIVLWLIYWGEHMKMKIKDSWKPSCFQMSFYKSREVHCHNVQVWSSNNPHKKLACQSQPSSHHVDWCACQWNSWPSICNGNDWWPWVHGRAATICNHTNGWKPEHHFFGCWVLLLLILATTLYIVEFLIETCPQSPAQWRRCDSEVM